jgi:hypothetical protein
MERVVAEGLRTFTVYGFVPINRLTEAERGEVYGRPEGVWIKLARLSAHSKGAAIAKAARQAWCRDDRAIKHRAEVANEVQGDLFGE